MAGCTARGGHARGGGRRPVLGVAGCGSGGGEQAVVRGRREREGKEKWRKENGKKEKRKRKRKGEREKERERCVGADRGERSRVADRRPSGTGWDSGEEKEGGNGWRKRNDRMLNELGVWDGGKIQIRV